MRARARTPLHGHTTRPPPHPRSTPTHPALVTLAVARNAASCSAATLAVLPLPWVADWRTATPWAAEEGAFDWVVASDVVYPTADSRTVSSLTGLLIGLLELNPSATILLAHEHRLDASGSGRPHLEFFEQMRRSCVASRVSDEELDLSCEEITLWRFVLKERGAEAAGAGRARGV